MAETRRTRRYGTYGNVAYQPEMERSAVRNPRREPAPEPRPRVRPRKQPAVRPSVEVRKQGAVAPFAVIGFAAVALCAILLVMTSAQLAVVNDETVDLRSALSDLQDEERVLQAQYEMAFDLAAIEAQFTADGSMVKAGAGQIVYLDLSEGDSVVYYEGTEQGLSAVIERAEQFLRGILS